MKISIIIISGESLNSISHEASIPIFCERLYGVFGLFLIELAFLLGESPILIMGSRP